METDTIYARLECADELKLWLNSGKCHYATLNTALYRSLTGKRILRRKDLEDAARKQDRIRAYFPLYKVWSEIPAKYIEFVSDCSVEEVKVHFLRKWK